MTTTTRSLRPALSSVTLTVLAAAYLLFLTNFTFWSKGLTYFDGHPGALAAFAAGLLALHVAALTVFSVKLVLKPLLVFLILVSALSAYFTDTFGVIINHDMIRNAAVTTTNEAKHLITPRFALHFLLFGALPAALLVWVRVRHEPIAVKFRQHLAIIAACLLIAGGVTYVYFLEYATVMRQHRDLIATLNPVSPISGALKYVRREFFTTPVAIAAIGTDAVNEDKEAIRSKAERPHVLVVVAGETARAKDFSLFGYERETNPVLGARSDILAFPNTTSCGTATAVSLPCMFSVYRRQDYSDAKGETTESVIDVLSHAGVKTQWWDANTGSKGVAARTVEINLASANDPRLCSEGECRDDILVEKLRQELPKVRESTVFVLHMIGSHGPAYYMRYRPQDAVFLPDCRTAEFSNCSRQEIVNAYDNTIVQTDRVLGQIIDVLETEGAALDAAMIYMSDHGESLGENGMFLHGAPWFMAPEEQIRVPFISWISPGYLREENLDMACLRGLTDKPYSHDNLFHSILGLIEVRTEVYDASLDVFAPCYKGEPNEVAGTMTGHTRP